VARTDALEIGAQRSGVGLDPLRRDVLEPAAENGMGVRIDAERGRPLWFVAEQVPGDLVEDRDGIGGNRSDARGLRGGAAGENQQRGARAEAGESLPAGDGCG